MPPRLNPHDRVLSRVLNTAVQIHRPADVLDLLLRDVADRRRPLTITAFQCYGAKQNDAYQDASHREPIVFTVDDQLQQLVCARRLFSQVTKRTKLSVICESRLMRLTESLE